MNNIFVIVNPQNLLGSKLFSPTTFTSLNSNIFKVVFYCFFPLYQLKHEYEIHTQTHTDKSRVITRGKGKEKEKEININVGLPLTRPLLGTWPTTQACALTGN